VIGRIEQRVGHGAVLAGDGVQSIELVALFARVR